jgi:glycosyltransferase involved in cell wall biosynthesis
MLRPEPWSARSDRVLFVGRIGREKGVLSLLEAWQRWGATAPRLEIVGDGPELGAARRFVTESGLADRVQLAGSLPFDAVQRRLAGSRLLLVPSLCFEGYPMVIREAFALGVPVAAGLLYPAFGLLLSPMIAALAMSLSSVSVVGNALRLRNAGA